MVIYHSWKRRSWKEHRLNCSCNRCFEKRHKLRAKRTQIDYNEYINGPLWSQRKEKYYAKHKRQCKACGTYKRIDLHHMVYGNFGKESDEYLIPLCTNCHHEFHQKHSIKANLLKDTWKFIRTKQTNIRKLHSVFPLDVKSVKCV